MAVAALKRRSTKIILTRPAVEAGESGALPGDLKKSRSLFTSSLRCLVSNFLVWIIQIV